MEDETKFVKEPGGEEYETNLQEQRDEVLALQSFYEGSDLERIVLLSSPDEDGSDVFSIKMIVPIEEQTQPVTLDILIPADDEDNNEARAITPPLPKSEVNFMRSDSGQKWFGSLKIDHLSPINLQVTFPPSYPSHNPPTFTLSSAWLSAWQLSALCRRLDALWEENKNMAITFTWIDWLENYTFSYLGITEAVLLTPFDMAETKDKRALPESLDMGNNLISILQFNRQQKEINFCKNDQDCDVCFDRLPGTQFHRIGRCGHHYCTDCMREYCDMHVKEGTVEELKCPDRDCEYTIPPYIIQAVLTNDAFERWERLMLEKTLSSMTDVVWCPRCNRPVIKEAEESLNLAHCTMCFYSFCTECNESWHQAKPCTTEEDKLKELVDNNSKNKNSAAQKRFDEMRKKLEQEIKQRKEMAKKVKKCPKCKIEIEKIAGCNKMTCRCGQSFCWICGKAIDGYSHFSNCSLFATVQHVAQQVNERMPAEGALWVQVHRELDPNFRDKSINCPTCKQSNVKEGNNNHMKCWNCATSFCFMCKKRIFAGTKHFGPSLPCKQHS